MMDEIIYLDYNATTPLDPAVARAMEPFLGTVFGNPSSLHKAGILARKHMEKAREQLARMIGSRPDEIIFTSGGTESNNLAIIGYCLEHRNKGNHIITSMIEHPSVLEVCRYLESQGFQIDYLPVDSYGMVNPDDVKKAIKKETILVSIMHANNETGTIQPIEEISTITKEHHVAFHTDAAQSAGKIKVDVNRLGVDLLSLAGHKFYAPKGIGALYIRAGIKIRKILYGAQHEKNLRPGTENILEIAGLGKAAQLVTQQIQKESNYLLELRQLFENSLKEQLEVVELNGHPEKRLPNTVNMSFPGIEAQTLLSAMPQIAASAGAACHSDKMELSHVLTAMGVSPSRAAGSIRFSLGRFSTKEEILKAVDIIVQAAKPLLKSESTFTAAHQAEEIKLTHYTHGLGCACKIRPQYLEKILEKISGTADENVIVGHTTKDDAAIYRISDREYWVQSVDFLTPVVDNPYDFGRIAAVNSLSDIYAMGGEPLFALNLVAFPTHRLPSTVLEDILKGAEQVAREHSIAVLGGHSIEDNEPKFGWVVSGKVTPDRLWRNQGAKEGDALILTKPLGTGILSTAMKKGMLSGPEMDELIQWMTTSHQKVVEIAHHYDIHACTDITGFGFLGHLLEMLHESGLTAVVHSSHLAFIPPALKWASAGIVPGGTMNNLDFIKDKVHFDNSVSEAVKFLLADAQTSGGLLFSLPENQAGAMIKKLAGNGISAYLAGTLEPYSGIPIRVY